MAVFAPVAGRQGRLKMRTKIGIAYAPHVFHQDRPLLRDAQWVLAAEQTAEFRTELCV
jgi:hypothetical protein